MASSQSVPSFESTLIESEKQKTNLLNGFLGILEVHIHQARDIHNICIYQNQDVYAKLCLTNNPENTVSTRIINGGGKNPIFNESLRLDVHKIDSSLKCEIWMLSRVRNYLEDQLLGFALVPLSEILINDGKLNKEFSLSSTDVFHSPAGYVELSFSYAGTSPEVIPLSGPPSSAATVQGRVPFESVASEFENIEFPDPQMVNENRQMVSEYIEISCNNLESQSSGSLVTCDTENHLGPEVVVQPGECRSPETINAKPSAELDSPQTSVSTNGTQSGSLPISCQSCETPRDMKSPNEEHISHLNDNLKEKDSKVGDAKSDESGNLSSDTFVEPVVSVNIDTEPKVVQQDIVDMYMKSMQQFTESLAKMKLPMDFESGPTSSGNSSSDQKSPATKNSGSRVFYGSRAFF